MITNIPTFFQIKKQVLSFREIHKRYSATQYGEKLRKNVRFLPYKPKEVTYGQWESLLGSDVNNLKHLWYTFSLTREFLLTNANKEVNDNKSAQQRVEFDASEQQLLQLTAVIHDWAEAIIGDIPYPVKTETDTKKEMVVLRGLIHEILGEGKNMREWNEVADQVEQILTDRESRLGKAFNAIERIGYTKVSLRAWTRSVTVTGDLKNGLERMGMKIVSHHAPALLKYVAYYPAISFYLRRHNNTITQIIAATSNNPAFNREKWFLAGKKAWEKRKT